MKYTDFFAAKVALEILRIFGVRVRDTTNRFVLRTPAILHIFAIRAVALLAHIC